MEFHWKKFVATAVTVAVSAYVYMWLGTKRPIIALILFRSNQCSSCFLLIYGLGIPSGLGPFVLSIKPIYNMGHVVDSSVDVNAEVNSF